MFRSRIKARKVRHCVFGRCVLSIAPILLRLEDEKADEILCGVFAGVHPLSPWAGCLGWMEDRDRVARSFLAWGMAGGFLDEWGQCEGCERFLP